MPFSWPICGVLFGDWNLRSDWMEARMEGGTQQEIGAARRFVTAGPRLKTWVRGPKPPQGHLVLPRIWGSPRSCVPGDSLTRNQAMGHL